jgi:carbonic anhydrase
MVTMTKEKLEAMSPNEALSMLVEGNSRFQKGEALERNFSRQREETAGGQFPFATVLSCIDSRTSSEIIFDQGIGDLFNVRLAGNVVNEDALGSMEFACKVAGSKVILVLGHEACGAVKGACAEVKMGNLTALLDKISPAVNQAKAEGVSDSELVDKATLIHIKNMQQAILDKSEVLKEMSDNGEIKIVGGIHYLSSGEVKILE